VRELKNCIQRAFILAEMKSKSTCRALAAPRNARPPRHPADCLQFEIGTSLSDMERRTILATLDQCSGDKRRTAKCSVSASRHSITA
jgi:DNA-binding NtrC family response regulator